jgi:hypothetical protein
VIIGSASKTFQPRNLDGRWRKTVSNNVQPVETQNSNALFALFVFIGAALVTAYSQYTRYPQYSWYTVNQTATTQPSLRGVAFVDVNGDSPGGHASVTVQTTPMADCTICFITPDGTIDRTKGLWDKTSDPDGSVSWTWKINRKTKPGKGSVTVTCNGASATMPIHIGS